MRVDFAKRIRGGYLIAFLLLLFSYLLTISGIKRLASENEWVGHTREVINKLDLLLSYLKDSEVGLRGFLIMKDEKFLLPYYTSAKKVDSIYTGLQYETRDNSLQQERLPILKSLLERKFGNISRQLLMFKESNYAITDSLRAESFESKALMDSIRFVTGTMANRENELLAQRTGSVRVFNDTVYTIILISLIMAVLMAAYSIITYNIENKARKSATREASLYHEELERRIQELGVAHHKLDELRNLEKFASTGRIARTIAHEVRNPLTNIELAADQLDANALPTEEKKILLGMISRNSKRINSLITDLLNATKFTELNYQETQVNELLDEALALALDRISLKRIQVEKDYAFNIPLIYVDRERIRIALLNIILNAIEAVPAETGVLSIITLQEAGNCIIRINDNGNGMDPETMAKIFDPYFTTKAQGNGLGLTNTQNIILNHRGKIQVSSAPARGTRFQILLNIEDLNGPGPQGT
jgi:signal transduction histidine kinase